MDNMYLNSDFNHAAEDIWLAHSGNYRKIILDGT